MPTDIYNNLQSALQYDKYQGMSINDAVDNEKVKSEFADATIRDWAQAIHTTWIETITLEQLEDGLRQVGKFTEDQIKTEADIYFLEVLIKVDTATILSQYPGPQSSPIFVDNYIKMTSNHQSTTIGQGTNELDTEELVPNESIEWTALADNGTDTIQLVEFKPSPINPNADFSQIIGTPVQEEGAPNKFRSYVKTDPQPNFKAAYSFIFTINNGTQQYTFDPWLGDQQI